MIDVKKIPKSLKEEMRKIFGVKRVSKKLVKDIMDGKYDKSFDVKEIKKKLKEIFSNEE